LQLTKGPPLAHHKVKVLEVVKDEENMIQEGDVVTVVQTGGLFSDIDGTYVLEIRDDPLMKQGETSLLFLRATSNEGVYGGTSPQTRFPILNGRVYWLGHVYTDRGIVISDELKKISGKTLQEVLSDLES